MKNKLILLFLLICMFLQVNAEGEATLKNIKVNGIECKCVEYNCEVEVDANSAIVSYGLVDSNATVDRQSGFSVDLSSTTTSIKITVTNTLNGEKVENTYTISIIKHEKSKDVSLKSLKVNGKDIKLLNDVIVYQYAAKYDEDKIVVSAEPNDSRAKIVSELSFEFDLDRSTESFDFDVKAENGDVTTYRIFAIREEKPDTSLKSLKINHGSITFSPKVLEYEFNVEYNINNISIEAIPNNNEATVKIEQNDLVVGENTIKIVVTNKKAESTYILKVTREENIDKSIANLKTLEISQYPNLEFDGNVLEYNLFFREIPSYLAIKTEAIDEDAKVEIINNKELEENDKVVVKVTLEDKNISREYVLNIVKKTFNGNNKTAILITAIILLITMIVLFVLEYSSKNKKKRETIKKIKEMNKKKEKLKKSTKTEVKKTVKNVEKKEEEEIEII